MDLNLGKRRSSQMSSSADHMASEVTRAASSSGAGQQQSYELIKSTQVGTVYSLGRQLVL